MAPRRHPTIFDPIINEVDGGFIYKDRNRLIASRLIKHDLVTDNLDLLKGIIQHTPSANLDILNKVYGDTNYSDINHSHTTTKTWAFSQTSGAGSTYVGGYYIFNAGTSVFSPLVNFPTGATNIALGGHILFVLQASSSPVATSLRVTGTSITDAGVRMAMDAETIFFPADASVNDYMETSKKFIGQVAIQRILGSGMTFNYGATKYWDKGNTDFSVAEVDVTWANGANDTGADVILRHHKTTGWTGGASVPVPPTAIASMVGDYVTETRMFNSGFGAWKRTNLSTAIEGSGSEGIILEIVSGASSGKTFEIGNFLLTTSET